MNIALFSRLFKQHRGFQDKKSDYSYDTTIELHIWAEPDFHTDHDYSVAFVGDPQYISIGDYFLGTKNMKQIFRFITDTAQEQKLSRHLFG